jgi:hypothetical protein
MSYVKGVNMEILITRVCTLCKIEKDSTCFYKDKRSKDGLQAKCKECISTYVTKQKTKDGYWKKQYAELTPEQKAKKTIQRLEYYHKNIDKAKAWRKKNYADNREKNLEEWHKKYYSSPEYRLRCSMNLCKEIGITRKVLFDWYINQHKIQKGCCAICGRNESQFKRRLTIDHCHKTNKLRGLLCTNCNAAIGNINDDAELCLSAYNYLRKN